MADTFQYESPAQVHLNKGREKPLCAVNALMSGHIRTVHAHDSLG